MPSSLARKGLATAITLVLAHSVINFSNAQAADDTALRLSNVSASNTGYIRVPNDPAFSLQTFTIEAWVQRMGIGYGHSDDASGAAIVAKPREGVCGTNIVSWHLHWTNLGQAHFNLVHTATSSGVYLTSPPVATPLGRHHIAVTFDGSTILVFIDGILSTQAAWTLGTVYYGADDVLIGADNFGCGFLRRFDGFIDDVRIWNYARTSSEIFDFMNCRLSGSESGLVAYWTFDGADLTDVTGHGHDGTVGGVSTSATFQPLVPISSCAVGVEESSIGAVKPTATLSVFPQPARDHATLSFELPRDGFATLELFDASGRRRALLASQFYAAGRHELVTHPAAAMAPATPSGVYFVRLRSHGESVVRRLIWLR